MILDLIHSTMNDIIDLRARERRCVDEKNEPTAVISESRLVPSELDERDSTLVSIGLSPGPSTILSTTDRRASSGDDWDLSHVSFDLPLETIEEPFALDWAPTQAILDEDEWLLQYV